MMERHFSEQEVTQVIRRAAELQERLAPSETPLRTHGIGRPELVRIAQELGIDERYVVQALEDPSTFAASDKGSMTGMDRTIERTAAALAGSRAFEIALDEFGPTMDIQSGPTTVGDTMTYQSMAGLTHCDVLVAKQAGSTRVKVQTTTYLPFLIFGAPAGLFTILPAISVIAGLEGVSVPMRIAASIGATLLLVGGIWGVMRKFNRWSNRKVLERVEALVNRLNREAKEVSQADDVEQARLQ